MAGIFARASAIARSQAVPAASDNYGTYLHRIEEAQSSMRVRLDQNRRRVSYLSSSLEAEEDGMVEWTKRVVALEATIDCYDGDTKGYEALARLYDTAKSMQSVFTSRVDSIQTSIDGLKAQVAPLTSHINQLTSAKGKLTTAQSIEQARGTMDRILNSAASTGIPSAANGDDQELRAIRRLIAESEALAELKG